MKENYKMLTIRIDWQDYELIKSTQKNLKMSSVNGVIKHLIYSKDSLYEVYHKSNEFTNFKNNKLRDK